MADKEYIIKQYAFRLIGKYFADYESGVLFYRKDSLKLTDILIEKYSDGIFDMIFADPSCFLSNGTCYAGGISRVDKGEWDRSKGVDENHKFNFVWLSR